MLLGIHSRKLANEMGFEPKFQEKTLYRYTIKLHLKPAQFGSSGEGAIRFKFQFSMN